MFDPLCVCGCVCVTDTRPQGSMIQSPAEGGTFLRVQSSKEIFSSYGVRSLAGPVIYSLFFLFFFANHGIHLSRPH